MKAPFIRKVKEGNLSTGFSSRLVYLGRHLEKDCQIEDMNQVHLLLTCRSTVDRIQSRLIKAN